MKNILKSGLVFLCVMMLFLCVSCQNEPMETETVVLQCNGIDITESIYKMYLYEAGSAFKEEHIPEYTDEEYAALTDQEKEAYFALLDSFWSTPIDGKMPFEIVRETALNNLKVYAFYKNECKKNNVAMTEEELRSFTSQMELYYAEQLDEIESLFGVTKDQYISYLAEMDVIASYVDIQASGISVSENEMKNKFDAMRETYAKVAVQTIFLKGEDKQELAEQLKARIENGESIKELVATYSDYKEFEDGSMVITGKSQKDEVLGNGYVKYVLHSNKKDIAVVKTDLGYCVVQTVDVSMVDGASAELKVIIQDEKYINRVTSAVEHNAEYDMEIVAQDCYDAINDVPNILK